MIRSLFFLAIFSVLLACNSQSKRPILGDSDYQRAQNSFFKDASTSPLKKKDLKNFKQLAFFPIDSSYVVEANLQLTPNAPAFKLPRTGGDKQDYRQYGILTFSLKGKELQLSLYRSLQEKASIRYKDYLFLPFTDLTSGEESYGGGRYMNLFISDIKEGKLTLNFNNTYNPYCAYNDKYSCPITPRKNHLDIAIKTGVKDFKKDTKN